MIKTDESSKANCWELEILCKDKKYLDKVVKAILKYGNINFEVEIIDCYHNVPVWDGSYTVLIWSSWFSNLSNLGKDLDDIEKKLEGFLEKER